MSRTVQTTYTENINPAFPGQPYDMSMNNAVSRTAEFSPLPFGRAVVRGTNPDQARIPDTADQLGEGATTGTFLGVVMRDHFREDRRDSPLSGILGNLGSSETSYIDTGETASVKRFGRIWVEVEKAVTAGDDVFYRHANAAGTGKLGQFTDTNSADHTQISTAEFMTSTSAAGLAVIELLSPA